MHLSTWFIGILLILPQPDLGLGFAPSSAHARTYASSGKLSAKKIKALQKKIARSDKALNERLKLARHYNAINEPDQVITYLRPVAEQLNVSGMRLLAKAYTTKKDFLQVIRVLEFLVSQNPNDYISLKRLGDAYVQNEKYKEGVANYQKALKINARYRPAYDGLLESLDKANMRYDRRETLVDMIKQFGPEAGLLAELCKTYYEDGFLEGAQDICQSAITKDSANADNHIYLGLTYEAAQNLPRAIKIIQNAAKQFKKSEAAQYTAAKLNESSKNTLAAYKYYKRAKNADKSSARAWLGFARLSFELKNYKEALAAFNKSCELERSKAVDPFRSAATRLKIDNNYKWSGKYGSASLKCRYKKD